MMRRLSVGIRTYIMNSWGGDVGLSTLFQKRLDP